jgi:hypothetical protein
MYSYSWPSIYSGDDRPYKFIRDITLDAIDRKKEDPSLENEVIIGEVLNSKRENIKNMLFWKKVVGDGLTAFDLLRKADEKREGYLQRKASLKEYNRLRSRFIKYNKEKGLHLALILNGIDEKSRSKLEKGLLSLGPSGDISGIMGWIIKIEDRFLSGTAKLSAKLRKRVSD